MAPDLPPSSSLLAETLATDAAATQLAGGAAGRHAAGNTHCLNCNTPLQGPYCHRCGQHDFDFTRSFGHMFLEALEGILHFDGKFFRNIIILLFRPGQLTAEFNAGRRASQMPPFRLYIFTAFVFFLLLISDPRSSNALRFGPPVSGGVQAGLTLDEIPITLEQAIRARDDPAYAVQLKKELSQKLAADGARQSTVQVFSGASGAKPTEFQRWIDEQSRRALQPGFQQEMAQRFVGALPHMLLLCLPFFAFYTRVLFWKSGQVYLQHLILALHFHTFIFLWVMFRDGWVFLARIPGIGLQGWVQLACNAWLVIYPVLMLRRIFANSWGLTLFKTAALSVGYILTLGAAFFVTAVILLLWI